MIKNHFIKKFSCVAAFLLLIESTAVLAADFSHKYSHYSDYEPLGNVLIDFAKVQGYGANVSPKLSGTLSGSFDNLDPMLFLDAMRAAYGVRYYVANNTVYFYHDSEWTHTLVKPVAMTAGELIKSLREAKISSPQLPIKIDSHGLLLVQGPAFYVDNIVNVIKSFDNTKNSTPIMRVFKLRYAKADDITINSMEQSITVPGVASILQRMVSGKSTGSSGIEVVRHQSAVPGLLGKGMASDSAEPGGEEAVGAQTSVSQGASAQPGAQQEKEAASVIADSRLNAVIVQDYPYRMSYYEDVIKELDKPARLVELHAAIIDVDIDASNSLGVNWGGAHQTGNWNLAGASGSQLSVPEGGVSGLNPNGGGIFSTIFETANSSFMMQINMLESDNKAKTLGRPSVITMDNVEATLEDTRTLYVPISGYQATDLFKVDSGTVLRVTPHIVEEDDANYIQMVISLQTNQDSDDSSVTTSTGSDGGTVVIPPAISQTKINTQALVREGQSLLIGGYYVEYSQAGDNGIPVLKDIPLIGGLFSSENKSTYQRERLLLITPRIVSIDDVNTPSDIDDQGFFVKPTQSDYNYRISERAEDTSGCSSTRKSEETPSVNQAQLVNDLKDNRN